MMLNVISKAVSVILVTVLTAVNATAVFAATPAQQTDQTIVDIAVADGRFTTLVAALQAADLVDTLNGEGPFTVFAPTDDAFAALPEGTVDALLADIPTLTNILLYHVVPGKVLAADVVNLPSADTVLGEAVKITVDGGTVKVNDAQVIITDIEASNGVIHVIDAVLLPPEMTKKNETHTPEPERYAAPPVYQGQRYYKQGHSGRNYRSYNRYGYNRYNRGNFNRGYYGKRGYNRGHYNKGYYGGRNYYGQRYYGKRSYNQGYYGHRSYSRGYQGKGYYGYRGHYR
jgi:uncharacterized surface protein with fasciclin (FAS1) repeats